MKIKPYTLHDRGGTETGFDFWCPGCNGPHRFRLKAATYHLADGTPTPLWQFDGNSDRPTFSPSLHIYYDRGHWEGREWKVTGSRVSVCHLHVLAGRINYLPDCQHDLAGRQGIDMPNMPETREEATRLAHRRALVVHRIGVHSFGIQQHHNHRGGRA